MQKLTATLCLTIVVFLGSAGVSDSADYQKGLAAFESEDYETALKEFQPLAENKGILSYLYSKKDIINAQYRLGFMYAYGKGVPKDYKIAVKWYRLAAEQEHASAQSNLGVMYSAGQGIIKDYVYAHMWGNIASSNGNKNGEKLRDIVTKEMNTSQIETAQKLARECVRKKYKGC